MSIRNYDTLDHGNKRINNAHNFMNNTIQCMKIEDVIQVIIMIKIDMKLFGPPSIFKKINSNNSAL